MIKFENVSKQYERNGVTTQALQDINLTIQKGDIYGIIGYSGAGKSILVRLINFLEKVNAFFVMNKIDYTNQNLAKLIKSENVEDPELFSSDETSNEIIEYIYDDENRIIQTKQSMYLAETKNRINMDCFFINHNKYGDWTKGYCSVNKKNLGDFKREIEYW